VKRLTCVVLCWLAVAAGTALAQDRGVSYSTWIVSDNLITLRFVLPVAQAQRLTGAEVPLLTISKLEDYLLAHLAVTSAGGECPAIDQGFDLGRVDPLAVGPDLYGFEILYRCSDPRQLVLRNNALFGSAPGHVNFAHIQIRGESVEQLFTAQHQQLALRDDRAVPAAGFGAYLRLGFTHVMRSADRWCFVLGLLLLVRRWREVGYLVLALAGGYLLAVLLSLAGWVVPRLTPLEAFMGFLVALLGALITQREAPNARIAAVGWPTWLLLLMLAVALLRSPAALWALLGGAALALGVLMLARMFDGKPLIWPGLVVLFSFLDGFVLPAVLPPAQLPQWLQLRMLIGFDLGAVLFEALLVAIAVAAWLLLRTRRITLPQAALNDVCAAGLSGLGAFWLVSRLG
jgi:HupE / UreJ protein